MSACGAEALAEFRFRLKLSSSIVARVALVVTKSATTAADGFLNEMTLIMLLHPSYSSFVSENRGSCRGQRCCTGLHLLVKKIRMAAWQSDSRKSFEFFWGETDQILAGKSRLHQSFYRKIDPPTPKTTAQQAIARLASQACYLRS